MFAVCCKKQLFFRAINKFRELGAVDRFGAIGNVDETPGQCKCRWDKGGHGTLFPCEAIYSGTTKQHSSIWVHFWQETKV